MAMGTSLRRHVDDPVDGGLDRRMFQVAESTERDREVLPADVDDVGRAADDDRVEVIETFLALDLGNDEVTIAGGRSDASTGPWR